MIEAFYGLGAPVLYELLLDLATLGYVLFYLPQIWRNRSKIKLLNMSLGWHAFLMLGACCDVFYGFGVVHQWQYRFVACFMLFCLLIQQVQLSLLTWDLPHKRWPVLWVGMGALAFMGVLICLWYVSAHHKALFFAVGWLERIGYWAYSIPQIVKQWRQPEATQAISPLGVLIALVTGFVDVICAWHFDWGPPSRYGSPVALCLHVIVLAQFFYYLKRRK